MQNQELVVIYLWGEINDKIALDVIEKLHHAVKNSKDVEIRINSDGGHVESAISIIDTMAYLQKRGLKITTIVCGRACSAAVNILIQGNKRYSTKNSFLMVHRSSYDIPADYDHVQKSTVDFWSKHVEVFLQMVVAATKSKYKKAVTDGMISGLWLTTEDALKMGLIDNIWE
jgi:ATP-dependent Clp endopeptidase proteolytic subunit ClpP